MSRPSLPSIKTPAVTASSDVLHPCLPTVWWADVRMIMPSRGLVSLRRAVSLPLSHTHHFHSLSEVKTKPCRETDDSDLVFFDIKLDSVTLTEPGLTVLAGFGYECINLQIHCGLLVRCCWHLHWKNAFICTNAHNFIPVLLQGWGTDSLCSLYVALIFQEIIFSILFLDFPS